MVRDPEELARWENIDLFVELIGGDEGAARESVEAALSSGKSVVTANKALLAKHGMELARLAEHHQAALAFEASVAGGIPIVKTLREGLAGNSIARVYGILNGTCNYILSRMELEGLSFAECLAEAQKLGYAEADPTFDIGGFDTAHKLVDPRQPGLRRQTRPQAISIEGIQDITLADLHAAAELGYRVKLLGVAQRTPHGVEQRVHPTMVPLSSAIAQVMGVTNAVTVDADAVDELTLVGPGAGGMATASAVVADIADIARGIRSAPFGLPVDHLGRGGKIADAAPRGRLLHPACGAQPHRRRGGHRLAHGRKRHFARKHRPAPRQRRRRQRGAGGAGDLCDDRSDACARLWRRSSRTAMSPKSHK